MEVGVTLQTGLPQGGLEVPTVPCVLTFRTSNAKDVEKAKKLIDQESMSFSTLIKVGVLEKTEGLNCLVPKLDSSANRLVFGHSVRWKIMLIT